jgi:hypothetical protein
VVRWSRRAASVAGLTFVGWGEPIGCGGVAVFPDDVIVVDDDGAVVIPAALIDAVAAEAAEQERQEAWIMTEVNKGASLPGLYPPNAENKARYVDHGVGAQFADLHRDRQLRHRCAEGSLVAQAGDG